MGVIHTTKADSINPIYHIMVVIILKNRSRKYFSHYIIKFIGFMLIYYAINLNVILLFMNFSNLYIESIDLLQV